MNSLSRRQFLVQSSQTVVAGLAMQSQPRAGVLFVWSGAMRPTSLRVKAKITGAQAQLLISTQADLSNAQSVNVSALSSSGIADFWATNLQPNNRYYYGIRVDGVLDPLRGRSHTAPTGASSFTFGFASCARSNSQSQVFQHIHSADPLFFMQLGDMHYENIAVNDQTLYQAAYEAVLSSPFQTPLYGNRPMCYMWDDHDYGPNNSDATSASRPAARVAYQDVVPHYPLVAGSGQVPIYQAFTVGRVRFIMTDTRSERNVPDRNDPTRSMLGATQKAWLKQELLTARDSHKAIIWACSSPWICDPPDSETDNWSGYPFERRELADFILNNRINNLFYISGDRHMLAADDGSNNRYNSSAVIGFPVFQAAALDQGGSFFSNNTYSEGQFPREHQYGLVHITDDGGDRIDIEYVGMHAFHGEQLRLKLTSPYASPLDLTQNIWLPIINQ